MRFAVALAAVVLALPGVTAAQSKKSIDWKNYSEAVWREARDSGKPILFEAWGEWCAPCRKMDQDVWSKPEIAEATKKFVCVSMRVDRAGLSPDQREQLGYGAHPITAFPTIAILDPWRDMLVMREGYMPAAELLSLLRAVPADYAEARAWREALAGDRNNTRALTGVGSFYQRRACFDLANRYYREALKTGAAHENHRLRENLMLEIAGNELRRSDWKAARAALEKFQRECPSSPRLDEALLGLVIADVRRGKLPDAVKRATELKSRFPESRAARDAETLIAQAKDAKPKR